MVIGSAAVVEEKRCGGTVVDEEGGGELVDVTEQMEAVNFTAGEIGTTRKEKQGENLGGNEGDKVVKGNVDQEGGMDEGENDGDEEKEVGKECDRREAVDGTGMLISVREGQKDEGGSNSSVILRIKRNEGAIVRVRYAEDGEEVEFGRHECSEQTESSDAEGDNDEEEDAEEKSEYSDDGDDNDVESELSVLVDFPAPGAGADSAAAPTIEQYEVTNEAWLKDVLEENRARRLVGGGDGNQYWYSEGLYTVDGDSEAFLVPQLEIARIQANRSLLVNHMAKAAFEMKLCPSGLYLAVLLLDFYWDYDRAKGRRMDAVQLQVLAYTCLYVSSNRFCTPGRTPDEFCQWAGGRVKGCMVVRQLEAFEKILQGPENVSSITSKSLWTRMKYLDPEDHMSTFIRDLETSEYGQSYFTADVLKDAYHVQRQAASARNATNDAGEVMKRRLLFAATLNARNKRTTQELSADKSENNPDKPTKLICRQQKIAVL